MNTIQDIHRFEQRIYDIVQDYIDDFYHQEDMIVIGKRYGKITIQTDSKDAVKVGKSTELYPLKELVRDGENGQLEPDNDKISDIANRCKLHFLNEIQIFYIPFY